jgi:hypothetical protein
MVQNTPLEKLIDNPLLSWEVLTTEGVEAVYRDNSLLEQLIIKDQPIQPGTPVIFHLSGGGCNNLGFQLVLIKKTLSRIHEPVEHWDRAVSQLH